MTKKNTIKKTKTMTIEKQPQRRFVETFETLITFLTIENNNFNIHSDP